MPLILLGYWKELNAVKDGTKKIKDGKYIVTIYHIINGDCYPTKLANNEYLLEPVCFFAVYVEASDNCNIISFNLADEDAERSWKMIARQYNCDYNNKAPTGKKLEIIYVVYYSHADEKFCYKN